MSGEDDKRLTTGDRVRVKFSYFVINARGESGEIVCDADPEGTGKITYPYDVKLDGDAVVLKCLRPSEIERCSAEDSSAST